MAVEQMQIVRTYFTMKKTREQPHCLIQYDMWVVFILLGMFFFFYPGFSAFPITSKETKQGNKHLPLIVRRVDNGNLANDYQPHLMGSVV